MKSKLQILFAMLFLVACSGDKKVKTVSIEPSEKIINSYSGKNIAIVLDDMKIDEDKNFISYKHKYNVLKMIGDSLHQEKKDWMLVNQRFFKKHKEDLGMEILSKHNGKISRTARPVGMGWAIGNSAHGSWEEVKDSTNTSQHRRRWRTHSMSPFFWYWLGTRRSYSYSGYRGYQDATAKGKSFYGTKNANGKYDYGTRSAYQEKKRSSFYNRKKSNSSRWTRLSRSSSRYSKGSSTRSRSGGFGK